MTTLQEKIEYLKNKTKELQKKQKAQKQAELRKKQKQEEKELLNLLAKYKPLLKNDLLLLEGVLINCAKNLAENNQERINYFYGLVRNKNS
ncbi:MAG: hypothetical protein Fur0028_15840 [Bacteroidales bacterium]